MFVVPPNSVMCKYIFFIWMDLNQTSAIIFLNEDMQIICFSCKIIAIFILSVIFKELFDPSEERRAHLCEETEEEELHCNNWCLICDHSLAYFPTIGEE